MNFNPPPESMVENPVEAEFSPEAPAVVVSICNRHRNLVLVLGIAMSCFALLALAIGLEVKGLQRLIVELEGFHEDSILPLAGTGSFVLAALAAANGVAMLHYWAALRDLRLDRRITVLHRTMCRMRTAWLTFGIFIWAGAILVIKAIFVRLMV